MLDGSILQKLSLAHRPGQGGKRLLNFGVYYKNTLVALCHALEDHVLDCPSQPLMVTAFQRGMWYLQEADRYGTLAARSRQVVIMAGDDAGFTQHPTSQLENVALITLAPEDPVGQEWHLIILSPSYAAMVLCQELSISDYGGREPSHDWERKFYGLWTFEPHLVHEALQIAIAHIGTYHPQLQQSLLSQVAAIATSTVVNDDLTSVVHQVIHYLQSHESPAIPRQGLNHFSSDLSTPSPLDENLLSNELQAFLRLAQLIDQTDPENPMAATEVSALAEAMGQLMDLPPRQLHRLRLSGLLHRLSPLPTGSPPSSPLETIPQMAVIGTIITHQGEWWDGSGQPAGLAGVAIPLESRILGLVTYFQSHLTHYCPIQPGTNLTLHSDQSLTLAFELCQKQGGERWDPQLISILSVLVNSLQQGLSLPVPCPKIAGGMWLLDSHSA